MVKEEINIKKIVIIIIFLGIILITISTLIDRFLNISFLQNIFLGLGVSIIGGAFIAWSINHLITKYNFEKVFENMTITNENIKKTFKLIRECELNYLIKIYEPYDMKYRSQEIGGSPSQEFTNDIKNALLYEEKEIKICGLSLRLFFDPYYDKFHIQMKDAFRRMDNNDKFEVKVLMLSPKSDWITQREKAEEPFAKNKLGDDLRFSIDRLKQNIDNLKNKDRIMDYIRFYDATPDFFLFITTEFIIFEMYHTGVFQLEKEANKDVYPLGLGGHVPVFMFDNNSPMYKYLNAQFDYYFEKKIHGEPNTYHAGTLKDILMKKPNGAK